MLAIGRALLTNPDLLIMDEPSEGLAPTIVEQVIDTCKALVDEGMAILLVEQNLGVATEVAERQLVMVAGRIAAETTRDGAEVRSGRAAPLPRRRAARPDRLTSDRARGRVVRPAGASRTTNFEGADHADRRSRWNTRHEGPGVRVPRRPHPRARRRRRARRRGHRRRAARDAGRDARGGRGRRRRGCARRSRPPATAAPRSRRWRAARPRS